MLKLSFKYAKCHAFTLKRIYTNKFPFQNIIHHNDKNYHSSSLLKIISNVIQNTSSTSTSTSTSISHEDKKSNIKEIETYKTKEDTIAAIITGVQQSAVAIIRVSGYEAIKITKEIFKPMKQNETWNPKTHRIYYGDIIDKKNKILDEVLCMVFMSPMSYTGEDVIEIHCHGGHICIKRIMNILIEMGVRLAKPGEFTMRAFLNGKIDLSQAESINHLITSRTVAAADSALAGLKGSISQKITEIRQNCIDILTELEARLDFDEDMPELNNKELKEKITDIQKEVEMCLKTANQGRLLRNGIQIAIVGRPNVGKSSLMNAWSGTDRAIVTDIPGTTRDIVETGLNINGIPITLLDTAGIRDRCESEVEKIGMEKSRKVAREADIVLMIYAADDGWTEADAMVFENIWGKTGLKSKTASILIANKIDKILSDDDFKPSLPLVIRETFNNIIMTSAIKNKGIELLDDAITNLISYDKVMVMNGGINWAINERQTEVLMRCHESLMLMQESIDMNYPIDCWTIDLKNVILVLSSELSGHDVTEEILDNIFNKFCIGK